MITARLDHQAIAAQNTTALAAWYEKVLGLKIVVETGPRPGQTQKTYLVGPPAAGLASGHMVEIMPANTSARHHRTNFDPGLSHLAFALPDFDAALAHLREQGVPFLGDIVTAVGGGRLISFADPEGNMLQIVERP